MRSGAERSQASPAEALARGGLGEQERVPPHLPVGVELSCPAARVGNDLLVGACRPRVAGTCRRTGEVALLSVQEGNRSLIVLREKSDGYSTASEEVED